MVALLPVEGVALGALVGWLGDGATRRARKGARCARVRRRRDDQAPVADQHPRRATVLRRAAAGDTGHARPARKGARCARVRRRRDDQAAVADQHPRGAAQSRCCGAAAGGVAQQRPCAARVDHRPVPHTGPARAGPEPAGAAHRRRAGGDVALIGADAPAAAVEDGMGGRARQTARERLLAGVQERGVGVPGGAAPSRRRDDHAPPARQGALGAGLSRLRRRLALQDVQAAHSTTRRRRFRRGGGRHAPAAA